MMDLHVESKPREKVEVIKSLVEDFRANIDYLFTHFDHHLFVGLIDRILACEGALIFAGVGKSGVIAQKIAATVTSSGTKALHLSVQNAMHGDIGIVGSNDLVFLLSKSGETDELLTLCPALRTKGATLIAIVANKASRLVYSCDDHFVLPAVRELCPFDIVPTTSSLAQLIFGDLLATALMKYKNVSLDEFILNHPAGRIGKRQTLRVRDLMLTGEKIPTCRPSNCLGEVLVELSNKQCGCICILDNENHLLGIFTDGDLRRSLQTYGVESLDYPMHELMTRDPRTICPDLLAYKAMQIMEDGRPITVLVVVEKDECVGILKMHDIVQAGL